jgi:hypothetical protein
MGKKGKRDKTNSARRQEPKKPKVRTTENASEEATASSGQVYLSAGRGFLHFLFSLDERYPCTSM